MDKFSRKIPLVNSVLGKVFSWWYSLPFVFRNSREYWIKRYQNGGNSGNGSFNCLAEFKAEILNKFVKKEKIQSIIEYGCGDGNQLLLYDFHSYIGFDISVEAIENCRRLFSGNENRSFKLMKDYSSEIAELTLSLDVIYHLVEDSAFNSYLRRLFDSSEKFVIIYSSNTDKNHLFEGTHVKHRKFTEWIDRNKPGWKLVSQIPNRYPFKGSLKTGSRADFYIFQKD